MSGSLSTEHIIDCDQWKVTDALLVDLWFWKDADLRVFFVRLVRRCGKQHTLPRSTLFSSVEDNTCRQITLILLSFHAKCPFLNIAHSKIILLSFHTKCPFLNIAHSKTLCPLLRLRCNKRLIMLLLFSTAVHSDRKQWKFSFINADIAESVSEWCATMLWWHLLRHLVPTLYIPITDIIKSVRCLKVFTSPK
jgi:hypothetical protein